MWATELVMTTYLCCCSMKAAADDNSHEDIVMLSAKNLIYTNRELAIFLIPDLMYYH